jgi:succinate-semialdehyde dehydrogenase/glutarate-semialdehyde dehydrogenase
MEGFDNVICPVASVIRARMITKLALANNSQFGLGSGVLTADKLRGEK